MNDLVRNIELADPRDAWRHTGDAPRVDNLDAYVEMRPEHATTPTVEIPAHLPLTVAEWRARTMAEPDFLLGNWLTTTSRVLITAATGLGKTNFALALGQAVSLGGGFLHWSSRRPSNVLYIDGEMSARLLRVRLIDEAARQGDDPEFFFALSHEDIPNFQPLNSPAGQDAIERIIAEIGSVDLIIFDNIMCLVAGDQKDTLPWQQTLPWALSLTRRCIGQIWVHHTGHDETRGYGDKAREWQMDTVIHLGSAKREDTDVSFNLEFRKARERTPSTRFDFQDVKIALVNDRWEHDITDARRPSKLAPSVQKALEALTNVLNSDHVTVLPGNRRAAHRNAWAIECDARGLIDLRGKAKSARTLMNRFRRGLAGANRIACKGDLQWLL